MVLPGQGYSTHQEAAFDVYGAMVELWLAVEN